MFLMFAKGALLLGGGLLVASGAHFATSSQGIALKGAYRSGAYTTACRGRTGIQFRGERTTRCCSHGTGSRSPRSMRCWPCRVKGQSPNASFCRDLGPATLRTLKNRTLKPLRSILCGFSVCRCSVLSVSFDGVTKSEKIESPSRAGRQIAVCNRRCETLDRTGHLTPT